MCEGEASPETQKELLEAVIGEVFLTRLAADGIDAAMAGTSQDPSPLRSLP